MPEIKFRGLKKYPVRKNGKVFEYCYHRATGVRMLAPFGSDAFMAEYLALNAKASVAPAPLKGTLGDLIAAYKRAPEFAGLAPRTRADYDAVFVYLKPLWPMPVTAIDGPFVIGVRDKAFKARKRRFANYVVQVISLVFTWGKPRRGDCAANPAADVPKIRRPKQMAKANRPWTREEWGAVWQHAAPQLRHVLALGTFAMMRIGDALSTSWADNVISLGGRDRGVVWTQSKTGDEVRFDPAPAQLLDELAAIRAENQKRLEDATAHPRKPVELAVIAAAKGEGVVCRNAFGEPWTASGFRASFRTLKMDLQRRGLVKPGLTFHGLRHTAGKMLADAGVDTRVIAAALGHRSLKMAEHYSKEADKDRLTKKAVLKLSDARKKNGR